METAEHPQSDAPVAFAVDPLPAAAVAALAAAGATTPEAMTAHLRKRIAQDLPCVLRDPPEGTSTGFVYRIRHVVGPVLWDTIVARQLGSVVSADFGLSQDSKGNALLADARTGDGAALGEFFPHRNGSVDFSTLQGFCPTPDALLRLSPPDVPVEHISLSDVGMMPRAWREAGLFVPVLRTADGTVLPFLHQKVRRLLDRHWADVCEASGFAPRPDACVPLDAEEQRTLAAAALSIFYRIDLPEARVMGLVGTAILPRILAAIIDAGTLRLLVAEAAREAADAGEDPPC